jgi:hypothetical protein
VNTQHQHSRKNFIAKLVCLGAATGVLPGLPALAGRSETARPANAAANAANATARKKPILIRADARSVARTDLG